MAKRPSATDEAAAARVFAPYDLVLTDERDRWVASVERIPHGSVWLGHRVDSGGVLVGTLPYSLFEEGANPVAWGAEGGALGMLVNLLEPADAGEDHADLGKRVISYLRKRVSRDEAWQPISWGFEGATLAASVFRFAGAWLAITADTPDAFVAIAGRGLDPEGIHLIRTYGESYGLDFAAPIKVIDMNQRHHGKIPQLERIPDELIAVLDPE